MTDTTKPATILSLGEMMGTSEADLGARFDLIKADADTLPEILRGRGADIRGIATRGKTQIGAELMDALPNLEIVTTFAVGYDAVDVAEARRRGIVATYTPDVLTEEVADFTIGLTLATIRKIPQADAYLRAGEWAKAPYPVTATMRDRAIGIAGMGRIGRAIAARLEPFGRPIAYHARRPVPELAYDHYPTMLGLARAVDLLIVILPGGPATKHAVNREVLEALGANGILINVARGSVADEAALVEALSDGTIAAAGLDVFEQEPGFSPALAAMDNVVLTPHAASGTHFTRGKMADLAVENLVSWFDGRGPVTPTPETPWKG